MTEELSLAPYLRYLSQVPKTNVVLFALWAVASLWLFFSIPIQAFSDTVQYRNLSELPLFPLQNFFYYTPRPFSFPLLIKFLYSDQTIAFFQLAFYIFSWLSLFLLVNDLIKPWFLGTICTLFLMLVSLSPIFFYWNRLILSESISFSGIILGFVLLCRFFLSPSPLRLITYSIVPLWIFWENSRDTNAYLTLSLTLPLLLACAVNALLDRKNKKWKIGILLFGIMLASAFFEISSSNAAGRAGMYLVNNIGQRILPDPEYTAEFIQMGMPMNEKVLCFKEKFAWDCSKDYSGFGDWLKNGGAKHAYALWLLRHMDNTIKTLLANWPLVWADHIDDYYTSYSSDNKASWLFVFASLFGLPRHELFICFISLTVIAMFLSVFLVIKSRLQHWTIVPLMLFTATIPFLFLCYYGDVGDPDRHCLPAQLQVYTIGWVMIFWLISFMLKPRIHLPVTV